MRAKYGRFPKTLIFSTPTILPHTSHADQLVKICRDVFGQGEGFSCRRSPACYDRGPALAAIRGFRNRPDPKIVVSVDMLTTGVDIPAAWSSSSSCRPGQEPHSSGSKCSGACRRAVQGPWTLPRNRTLRRLRLFQRHPAFLFQERLGLPDRSAGRSHRRRLPKVIADIWNNRDRAYNVRCPRETACSALTRKCLARRLNLFAALRPKRRSCESHQPVAEEPGRRFHRHDALLP